MPSIVAIVTGIGCFVALPTSTFRTHAVVALEGGSATLRPVLTQVALDTALSKPILDRAASSLLTIDGEVPAPDLAERLNVAAGGNAATSRQARLADAIAAAAHADPGLMAGTLDLTVTSARAEQAAHFANALADAFVTQQDDAAIQTRLRFDEKTAAHIEEAKAASLAARQKLIALGGVSLDPVQSRNEARAQTVAAESRLATVRMIMASGSPPLTDRKDLPAVLAGPQAAYLDLKAQLAKESEVLGERHTTIIALQDGLKRSAATLSAEWNRLRKIAEADVAAAHDHEAALRKTDAPTDTKRRDAIEDARRAVVMADQALAFAQKQQDIGPDATSFRLIARAPVPKIATGLSLPARLLAAALAGLAGLALAIGLGRLWASRSAPASSAAPVRQTVVDAPARPKAPVSKPQPASVVAESVEAETVPAFRPALSQPRFSEDEVRQSVRRPATRPMRPSMQTAPQPKPQPGAAVDEEANLVDAMRAVLDVVDTMETRACPTVMVAANEDGLATTAVALALGRAAADRRWRVLLIEADRTTPTLAAAAAIDADPVLVDLYGTLRVGLAAEGDDRLVLAPVLRDAARLAANLARDPTTPLIDDLASTFDLVVIDGAVADDAAAAGWTADAFVRVGSRTSRRDDETFCATFDISRAARLATILETAPAARPVRVPSPEIRPATPRPAPSRARTHAAPMAAPAPVATATPRRKIVAR